MTVEHWTVAAVIYGAVVANLYPALYALRSPWRSTSVGWALMTKAVSIAALYDVSLAGYAFGPFPGFHYIYAVVVTFVAIAITGLLAVMLATQHAGRNRRTPSGEF